MKKITTNTTMFSPSGRCPTYPPDFQRRWEAGGVKKLLLILTFTFCFFTFSFPQEYGWKDISANIPGDPDLSDVFFVSDNEGWITSSSHAEIYHTTDGGKTFEVQTTQYPNEAIEMVNADTGYAGGVGGIVYKTTDGGKNWELHGFIGKTLTDISFPPVGDTGFVCGLDGVISSITASGVTPMNNGLPDSFNGISFPFTSNKGWVCGGSIIQTYANGMWGGATNGYPSGCYNAIFMVDTLNGWAAGDKIIHTSDGQNWFDQENPNNQEAMTDIFFLNESEGWIVGNGGLILHTTNGGNTWIFEVDGFPTILLRGVHFTSSTNGYVVGNNKTLLKYTKISGIEEETETLKCNIFPNPAKNKLQIKCYDFKTENGVIEILSLNGKKIMGKEIEAGIENIEIDANSLQNGLYFFRIRTENGSVTKKLMIQK